MSEGNSKEGKPLEIEVNITGKEEIERLQKELEEERTAKEDALNRLELAAEAQFQKARKALGAPESITTTEELEAWKLGKGNSGEIATGKAPLNYSANNLKASVREYESYEQMAKNLSERESDPNPEVRREAKEIKDKMFSKMLKGKNVSFVSEIPSLSNSIWEKQINEQLASKDPHIRAEAKERLKKWNSFKVKVKGENE